MQILYIQVGRYDSVVASCHYGTLFYPGRFVKTGDILTIFSRSIVSWSYELVIPLDIRTPIVWDW